jgi:hypothetical protein
MVAHECPDIAHFRKMPLNFERPAFNGGFSFPQQFFVTMPVSSINVIFRRIIAEQAQVEKIGSARQEFEWREIAFVERTGIGPDPTDAIFFH